MCNLQHQFGMEPKHVLVLMSVKLNNSKEMLVCCILFAQNKLDNNFWKKNVRLQSSIFHPKKNLEALYIYIYIKAHSQKTPKIDLFCHLLLDHLMACANLAPCHGLLVQILLIFESGKNLTIVHKMKWPLYNDCAWFVI